MVKVVATINAEKDDLQDLKLKGVNRSEFFRQAVLAWRKKKFLYDFDY